MRPRSPIPLRMFPRLSAKFLLSAALCLTAAVPASAAPNDVRLQPLKDLNGYFPFTPPKSKAEWEKRAEYVRRQILVSQGLWPMPTKTPLNAVIHGKIDRPEYTIEKVYFESVPGLFRNGESLPAEEPQGQGARGDVCARALAERAAFGRDGAEAAPGNRHGAGAVRAGRPEPLSIDVRAARPDGLRRLAIRYAQRLRRRADST